MKNTFGPLCQKLVFCLLAGVTGLSAETPSAVIRFSAPGLSLSGSVIDKGFEINIKAKASKSTSVFSVETPYRLVVDLFGVQTSMLKKIQASDNSFIKSARIGSHKDKTRIVFDLAAATPPSFKWTEERGEIRILIGSSADLKDNAHGKDEPSASQAASPAQEIKKEPPKPAVTTTLPTSTAIPSATPSPAAQSPSPSPSPSATPSVAPTATKTSQPSPAKTAQPQPSATETAAPALPTQTAPATAVSTEASEELIKAIAFETTTVAGPALVVSLNSHPEFRLSRRSDRVWALTIPRCASRDERFNKPWFPSEEFAGFAYFRVTRQEPPAEIEIGVERNIKITALPDKERIIVKIVSR